MNVKNIFKGFKLTTRSGAALENAVVELMQQLQKIHDEELRAAFIHGAKTVSELPYQIDIGDDEEFENLADESGYA